MSSILFHGYLPALDSGCFQFIAIMSKASVNICMQVFASICVSTIMKRDCKCMLSFTRNFQMAFLCLFFFFFFILNEEFPRLRESFLRKCDRKI